MIDRDARPARTGHDLSFSRGRWLRAMLTAFLLAGPGGTAPGQEDARVRAFLAEAEKASGAVQRSADIPGRPVVGLRLAGIGRDDDLNSVATLIDLRSLDLSATATTDDGLRHLDGLVALRSLNLSGTKVTDDGLRFLIGLVNLEALDLSGTTVSEQGVARLRRLHPNRGLKVLGGPFPGTRGVSTNQINRPWPDAPPPRYEGREVVVYYGTNREPTAASLDHRHLTDYFTGKRGPLRFGFCRVGIPEVHQVGRVERPWSLGPLKFPEDPRKHFVLRRIDPASRDEFFGTLKAAVDRAGEGRKSTFVFVHGYNVSFDAAAYRTAQLAADLDFEGPAILFSWPTQGRLEAYLGDAEAARLSASAIQEFLEGVAGESGAERIHIIAHSMGNLALTGALTRLALEHRGGGGPRFDQILLAAPDIDAEVFREEVVPHFPEYARNVTLYASKNDRALMSSRALRDDRPRIGEDVTLAGALHGVDAVDASAVDTSFLGHSYFGERSELIGDISKVFLGRAPGDRGLRSVGDGAYWAFGAQPPSGRPRWPLLVAVALVLLGCTVLLRRIRATRRHIAAG